MTQQQAAELDAQMKINGHGEEPGDDGSGDAALVAELAERLGITREQAAQAVLDSKDRVAQAAA